MLFHQSSSISLSGRLLKNNPFDLRTLQLGLNNEIKLYRSLKIICTPEGFLVWIGGVWILNDFGTLTGRKPQRKKPPEHGGGGGDGDKRASSGSRSCRNQSTQPTSRAEISEIVN